MRHVNEIRVVTLACKCGRKFVWVDTFPEEKQPSRCSNCNGSLFVLTGQVAADLLFRESSDWHAAAEITLESVKSQLRTATACKLAAIEAQKQAGLSCV